MIIAKDLQARGVESGDGEHDDAAGEEAASSEPPTGRGSRDSKGGREGRGSKGGRGRSAFASRVTAAASARAAESDCADASAPQVQHIPIAAEQSADPAELAAVRD
eukprot:3258245-Pleurochrysis_carterae.AAC.1